MTRAAGSQAVLRRKAASGAVGGETRSMSHRHCCGLVAGPARPAVPATANKVASMPRVKCKAQGPG